MWYSRLKTNVLAAAVTTLLLAPAFSQAQSNNHPFNCGADQYWQEKVKQNPELDRQKMQMLTSLVAQRNAGMKGERSGKYIIPVVFHVIHTYGSENIPRQKMLDNLKTLNEQYAGLNKDLSSVRDMFKNLIGVPDIEFRMATKDPNGNCTDGVDRIYSPLTENARDNVKSLSYWDATKYLNIWVVSSINDYGADGTVLAYAQFPWDNNNKTDGVVIRADQVTTGNATLAHEIGHYLGLMHTFESYAGAGCGNPCGSSGDFMCDTPPSTGPSWGCPSATYNTCSSDQPDEPDMWENFMDYSSCQHMFTLDQVAQIHAVLDGTPKRMNLVSAANLMATGTDDNSIAAVCTPTPKADFYSTQNVVCEGGSINFMDNSYNATPTAYLWTFEDGTPTTSSTRNPTIKFTKAGVYKVKLKVSTSSGSNEIEKTAFVTVMPTVSQTKAPINQNFESFDATGYTFSQDSKGLKWTVANKAATSGSNSIWLNNSAGVAEESYMFTLPMVDMTATTDDRLTFKIASAQKSSSSTDELRVQVSSTCGQNFNSVYYKFGASLATTTNYYTAAFVPTANQWKDVVIDLSSYKNVKNLIVRFNLKNRGGNNLYIDDINLGGTVTGIADVNAPGTGVSLYPNPATNMVNLSVSGVPAGTGQVEIFDAAGRQLQNISSVRLGDGAPVLQLDRHAMNLPGAGIYMVKITLGNRAYVQKLVITE